MTSACRARLKTRLCSPSCACVCASARGESPCNQKKKKRGACIRARFIHSYTHTDKKKMRNYPTTRRLNFFFFFFPSSTTRTAKPRTYRAPRASTSAKRTSANLIVIFLKPPSSSSSLRNTSGWQGGWEKKREFFLAARRSPPLRASRCSRHKVARPFNPRSELPRPPTRTFFCVSSATEKRGLPPPTLNTTTTNHHHHPLPPPLPPPRWGEGGRGVFPPGRTPTINQRDQTETDRPDPGSALLSH